ncbi:tRNA (adenosine(37)-N6)-threonylcarbamoyltransferase complex ATPase subunit type 1 TsaE [Thiomicrorhabdus hydrogeniphila]
MNNALMLADESESIDFARKMAELVKQDNAFDDGLIVYLYGDLGAGKSFFSRAFVQYFLPGQKVKSPTYTIVESYNFSTNTIHHLDLYRLCDSEELEYLAIRDLLKKNFVALIEWPQKGAPILPKADIELEFLYQENGRKVLVKGGSDIGKLLQKQIVAN